MTPYLLLNDIIAQAEKDGGGTFWLTPEGWLETDHTFGYFVSEPRGIERLPKLYRPVIWDFVASRIVDRAGYLGLWRDEDGLWSIDVTHWVADEGAARLAANVNGQRAFWDIKNGVAVPVEP